MLTEREDITNALDHALTAIAALRRESEGKETTITLKEIEQAMDDAWTFLSR
jgi:hypothetical protein